MADSVLLAGTDARIEFTVGQANIDAGPITMAFVLKRTAVGNWDEFLTATDWDNYRLVWSDGNQLYFEAAGGGGSSATTQYNTAGVWLLVAVTKAAGTVLPRFHSYDGTTWVHENGNATETDGTAASAWKFSNTGGDAFAGNGLIFGIADTVFSDTAIETLANGYQAWIDAGFLEGVRLNSASGLETFTNGSMAQGTTVNATLDTGDAPTWWDDALGGATQRFMWTFGD